MTWMPSWQMASMDREWNIKLTFVEQCLKKCECGWWNWSQIWQANPGMSIQSCLTVKRFCQTFKIFKCQCIRQFCVLSVISLISESSFTAWLSCCIVIYSVVDMLWKQAACHLLRQAFLHQAYLLSPCTPTATPHLGCSVCRWNALDGQSCN